MGDSFGRKEQGEVGYCQQVTKLLRGAKDISSTPQAFRFALRDAGVVISDEKHLADIIVGIMPRPEDSLKWNLDVIAEVLSQDCNNIPSKKINWKVVVECFDNVHLAVRSMDEFQWLAKLFLRISGVVFPASGLVGTWNNRAVQLNMLILAANCKPELVMFYDMVPTDFKRIREASFPPNLSYMCLPLYDTLLDLASRGMRVQVLKTLLAASEIYPEYVTILLAQAKDVGTSVRGEVLTRTLQKFTGLSGSRPTSLAVMRILNAVNPGLLVWLFRLALKRATTSKEIFDLVAVMTSMGEHMPRRVEEEGSPDELVSLWCVKADRSECSLEAKVRGVLDGQPHFAKSLAIFLRNFGPMLRSKGSDGSIVSYESFCIILGLLTRFSKIGGDASFVSTEDIRELSIFARRFQPDMKGSNMSRLLPDQISDSQDGASVGGGAPAFDEIERDANSYFQKLYTSEMSVENCIQLLKRFKLSSDQKEQDIFRCMIHNLFDEYRFYQRYREKELQLTGSIFGMLIQHQLVSSITLGIALRYVLEAIRKDPASGTNADKMFRIFGKTALEQFKNRLHEWPQYCSHLLQIPHFARMCPQLYQETQNALNNPNGAKPNATSGQGPVSASRVLGSAMSVSGLSQPTHAFHMDLHLHNPDDQHLAEGTMPVYNESSMGSGQIPLLMEARLGKPPIIETMIAVNADPAENPITPPDKLRDQIYFIINNVAQNNFEAKSVQLRKLLTPEYYSWFASYLVSKRISTQPNHHALYISVLDILDSPALIKVLLSCTYYHVTSLLQSPNITTSSSERSLLRNLGMWLGQMTLARNKPILQRRLNLKELLFWGFETGRLIAVCSFVAKIIEGVRDSIIFRPPNPWLMALLGVLRDLYETEDLKMNIKFEVQVLCKSVNIRIEDIPKAHLIGHCRPPIKDARNSDFNVKVAPTAPSQKSPPLAPKEQEVKDSAGVLEQPVIQNLAAYVVVNPSLQLLATDPSQRRLVVLAVDKAIREVIQPAVERAAHQACITTQRIVLKDFSSEPNEVQLRNAAHVMVSNIAGMLAVTKSKDALRVCLGKHLRAFMAALTSDQVAVDQVVQMCSNDNLDLGCALIRKAAAEKAIRDIDEQLSSSYLARRKARDAGQAFVDTVAHDEISLKYIQILPESIKLQPQGATAQQMAVYEEFQRMRVVAPAVGAQAGSLNDASPEQNTVIQQQMPVKQVIQQANAANALNSQQALDAYKVIFTLLEAALNKVQVQLQGREVTLSMLGGDHEILSLLREVISVTQRTQANMRIGAAMVFAESIFKRLMETPSTTNALQLDVLVGCLEALRDACGGPKKFVPDVTTWLTRYSAINVQDEVSRRIHRAILTRLLRANLLRSQEADIYFASCMDSGRNMLWVELALSFVRQCLADGLAATYEFTSIFNTVSKMRPTNAAVRKQLQKWLTDLHALAASKDEQKITTQQQSVQGTAPGMLSPATSVAPTPLPVNPASAPVAVGGASTTAGAHPSAAAARSDAPLREHVTVLLERWLRVWSASNDQIFGQYLQLMHQYGVLKTEGAADRFFRIATELCVEACLKSAAPRDNNSSVRGALVFTVIDALSKLFLLLIRLADKEAGAVQLLSRILSAIVRTLIEDHDTKKISRGGFDQRPYYRLLSNLSLDLGTVDPLKDSNPKDLAILSTYSHVYSLLVPPQVPGFAFAWLQLISHRCFMPHLLLVKGQKGWPHMHRLLISLLLFLKPFLKSAQMNEAIRKLYKGMVRVLLVLLHDFPEFLSDYHVTFCDAIPATCVQLRNLILSAFPRSMRLPDPFTSNLKLDTIPEINVPPRLLADYSNSLGSIRPRLENYLSTKQPAEFPTLLSQVLLSNGEYQVTLISILTLYIGAKGSESPNRTNLLGTPAMEVFKYFAQVLDPEGRYHVLNAMANQLRYPNSHTHYFSCVLLTLFAEADTLYLKEQITRVLLERLIVHRPHPWGLLVTFIELIKNPRYAFWQCPFTKCAPEIEKVFESVARSCLGSTTSLEMGVSGKALTLNSE